MMKKTSLLLFIIVMMMSTTQAAYKNLHEKLTEVNAYWSKQPDIPQAVYELAPILDEKIAIRTHLQWVEQILRLRPVTHLNPSQQHHRVRCLDILNQYWKAATFPQNHYLPYRNPVFIDANETFCAVGYLVKETGFESVSRDIAAHQNFAYVSEIQNDALIKWAQVHGFSLDELAWIQPGYPPTSPTTPMKAGVGGGVYEILQGDNMSEIMVGGSFQYHVSAYYSGFAGYDWMIPANVNGGNIYAMEYWNGLPIIAGDFTEVNNMPAHHIVALAPNGSGIMSMGNINGVVKDVTVFNNELYAAGADGVLKWDGNNWQSIGTVNGQVRCMYEWMGDLYIGGDFTTINGINAPYACKYDGNSFIAMGNALSLPINTFANFQNHLVAAGDLHTPSDTTAVIGKIWKWKNNTWNSSELNLMGHSIYSLAAAGNKLYIGGDFREYFSMIYGKNLAIASEPNPDIWECEMLDNLDAPVYVLKIFNNTLYVGGDFSKSYTFPAITLGGIGTVAVTSAIDKEDTHYLTCYPNPANSIVLIDNYLHAPLQIYDMQGRLVQAIPFTEQKSMGEGEVEINIEKLPSGLYFLQLGERVAKMTKN